MLRRRRHHRQRRRDAGVQVAALRARFPGFTHLKTGPKRYVFEGELQPTEQSRVYRVRVFFTVGSCPVAHVVEPELHKGAPHRWKEGSLCLFHPRRFKWTDRCLVASYIIPWVTMWLYFYEQWLDLGVWLGPEVPHEGPK